VIVAPHEAADPAWLVQPVLSSVMGVVLQRRGVLTLHASVVRVGDSAWVIAGAAGSGKSTLAEHIARRGQGLHSDGFAAVTVTNGIPAALPGPPVQKLWPDTARHFGLAVEAHPTLAPRTHKRLVVLSRPGDAGPLPIARILVLDRAASATSGQSEGRRRLGDLAGQLFLPGVVWGQAAAQAALLFELVRHCSVERLARPSGPMDRSLDEMTKGLLESPP
jgi:hypothetical protein